MTRGRLNFYVVLALCSAIDGCASAGMPTGVMLRHQYNGGNCETIREVDAQGQVSGSSGCESGAHDDGTWRMSAAQLTRLVAALDRLRARRDDVVIHGEQLSCGANPALVSVLLVERSGRRRRWDFCPPGLAPRFPPITDQLMWLLSQPR